MRFGARALALERTAKLSQEWIERIQRRRLERLVRHARANSEFYREKFAGVDDSAFELSELPISTKTELMENFDRVLTVTDVTRQEVEVYLKDDSNLGVPLLDKYAVSHTSGSQGQPMLILQSLENLELLFALQVTRGNHEDVSLRELAAKFTSPARLAAITLKPGFYPTAAAFAFLPEGVRPFVELLQVSSSDADLIERLAEFRPTHLTSYASILHLLARHVEQGRLALDPELEQVVNISERLLPQTRRHYEQIFAAPVLDDYGFGECLFVTNGCPTTGGMHVNADWAILEAVDESNQPVPPGEQSAKVLVTNLANHILPFIRYEVGDLVTMADKPCDCGSSLPRIKQVGGRDSDMFYLDTEAGRQPLSPAVFEVALTHALDAREYQIIQEANTQFRILIEPLPGVEFDRARVDQAIAEQLAEYDLDGKLQLEIEVVDRLEGADDAKFKRVVSNVASSQA
jgi:phenylacetate-coenzyme A ligase PaaK-like adenylate-forming protein